MLRVGRLWRFSRGMMLGFEADVSFDNLLGNEIASKKTCDVNKTSVQVFAYVGNGRDVR
jgi:hypothetical protein